MVFVCVIEDGKDKIVLKDIVLKIVMAKEVRI
jgi:hypothetical protein